MRVLADATLAPMPAAPGLDVLQTGAWILEDSTPLPPALEAFLDQGEPPVYFGFGSMPTREDASRALIGSTRAAGRRAIISQGWGGLDVIDDAPDCIAVGDVNQQALFSRVAAVVHHGGAGTTTTAARAGAPQVVTPMFSDQFYWGHRVRDLGSGTFEPHAQLTIDALTTALHDTISPETAARARLIAAHVTGDGALVAARGLIASRG
jgi:vancomycin aglycone glucosyltransferase